MDQFAVDGVDVADVGLRQPFESAVERRNQAEACEREGGLRDVGHQHQSVNRLDHVLHLVAELDDGLQSLAAALEQINQTVGRALAHLSQEEAVLEVLHGRLVALQAHGVQGICRRLQALQEHPMQHSVDLVSLHTVLAFGRRRSEAEPDVENVGGVGEHLYASAIRHGRQEVCGLVHFVDHRSSGRREPQRFELGVQADSIRGRRSGILKDLFPGHGNARQRQAAWHCGACKAQQLLHGNGHGDRDLGIMEDFQQLLGLRVARAHQKLTWAFNVQDQTE
mmetsp:Transcript_49198/g.82516  ORF Transcript_49198/g.82516 Transcript_49198/m.82516 type:complete len:280 (-) Transcript_49198:813-1652(-)